MEKWIMEEIINGLQKLHSLRLQDRPGADEIQKTTETWLMSISKKLGKSIVEQVDRPRIREGFNSLAANNRRWPAPIDLIDAMPSRPVRKELREPPPSHDEIERGRAKLKEIQGMLAGGMK